MTLPTGYLPREGDLLTIRCRVRFNVDAGETEVHVAIVGADYKTFLLSFSDIVDLHCRAWEPHDKVKKEDAIGEVIAVDDGVVWVKFEDGTRGAYPANELVEAQPDAGPAA